MIVDVPTSSVGLAVSQIATRQEQGVHLASGPATSDLTGKACSPNTVHWTYDTWTLANGTGSGDRQDRRRHLVLPDGRLRLRPCAGARHRGGGAEERRQGARQGAPPASRRQDFSSFLLQAQASKAKIIGLANAGGDTINSIKQAAEFGIVKGGQNLAGLLVFITDVHGARAGDRAGPDADRDLLLGPERRDPRLVQALRRTPTAARCPTMVQAGVYAAVLHYLKAVEARQDRRRHQGDREDEGTAHRRPAVRQGHDPRRRPQAAPTYLFEVKKPSESKGPGTTTRCAPPSRPTRPSGRWTRASARWCKK